MRPPKGSILVYAGMAIVALGLLVSLFFGVKSYLDGVDQKAFERGQREATVAYQKRDNEALAAVTKQLAELQIKLRAQETAAAAAVAEIDVSHQKEIQRANQQRDRDVADAGSGALRLRDYWRDEARSCTAERDRSAESTAAGTASGADGARGAEFSRAATSRLLGEANRADEIVRKLTALQNLVRSYLKAINGDE